MSKSALICDTSVLLYLGRVKHQHVLPELFETVYVPETVLLELDAGRLLRSDTINPRKLDWVIQKAVSQEEIRELPSTGLVLVNGKSLRMHTPMAAV
jgi:predicted nucleic acid-binding protein